MPERNRVEKTLHQSALRTFRSLLCTFIVVIGLLEFMQGYGNVLIYCGGAVALITLLFVFPVTGKYTRLIAIVLFIGSMAAAVSLRNINPWQFVGAFNEMNSLIALLAVANLLGIVMQMGRFADLFRRFYVNTKKLYQPYVFSLLISYIFCFFSIMGAVAPAYYLINENLKKLGIKEVSRIGSTCISRAYAMAVIVSPAAATVGIALKYSGLSWFQMVKPVFLLSMAGLLAAFLVEPGWRSKTAHLSLDPAYKVEATGSQEAEELQETNNVSWKRLFSFIMLLTGIISSITFLGNVLHFSPVNSIAVGCLLVIFAWGGLSGNLQPVLSRTLSFFKNDVLNLSDQIVLLTAAGVFTFTMEHSGGMEWLGFLIEKASGMIGIAALLSLLPLIIVLLSFTGLHPFASAIIIAKTLLLSSLHFTPLAFAVSLMSGMAISFSISPFSGPILILASLTRKSPYEIGAKWNYFFVAVFLILSSIFIKLITVYG